MKSVSGHVESLTLNYIQRCKFQQLAHCQFPRVHSLDCIDPYDLSRCSEERYTEDVVEIIQKSFPNLESLKVKGFRITYGKNLFAMKNLKRLQLNFL